jgi:S-adenosylmethionine-dependent methyltransferase
MKQDVVFNTIANQFESDIYGSSKGYIRWNVLWHDLITELPQLNQGNLQILDAGGGAGRMSIALARLGNHVTLCEPSMEMLEKAKALATSEELYNINFVNQSLQDYTSDKQFDVILNHAVLEWLAQPKEALGHLINLLQPNGYLSLMFHNRNAALFKQAITGNFDVALQLEDASLGTAWKEETRPLLPQTVRQWLMEFNLNIISQAGIRMFHDFVPESKRQDGNLEKLLEIELSLRKQEPFASLAQHIHMICQKEY